MSEKILKALMQLFAIIARPESEASNSSVVEFFLRQQLNEELVKEYLKVFNKFYEIHQKKFSEKSKFKKHISASSVKVLRICSEINKELTQKQKIVVLIRLLEYIKSEIDITEQTLEFLSTVAEAFHISDTEYLNIKSFTLTPHEPISNPEAMLVIDNNKNKETENEIKHLTSEGLSGQIRILQVKSANMYIIRYFGDDELYINAQLIHQNTIFILNIGSSIKNTRIVPIYYSDIVSAFTLGKTESRIFFEVNNISYFFKNGQQGLHNINILEQTGKLVGIMGASGTGKTTLLNVLNGSAKPAAGEVLINGIDIYEEKEKVDGLIGFVSQDDFLIEELTVFENLYFNSKLCFDNYNEFQILRTALRMLQSLGLYDIKDMKVGSPLDKKISGGQRKRLNIALELIREPAILFLDEPTSGLSSRDSENILDLLKELALKGKLVIAVVHQPSSDLFKMFDKLIILDNGGHLIYSGDPIDSIIYFKSRIHQANWNESECHCCGNVNPDQIFKIVESQVIDEYGNPTHTRRISPKQWSRYFREYSSDKPEKSVLVSKIPELSFKIPGKIKQLSVFIKRDVLSKISNMQYLVISIFESPVLAFLLTYIIKYSDVTGSSDGYDFYENSNLPIYLFMAVIIALFIGLTASAEEVIKDRKLLKREAFLNLNRTCYLFSKIAILFGISAIQALIFVLIGNLIFEIKGMFVEYWLVLFSVWCNAILIGLNISDGFKTTVTIYILIPFLIIPQIILSGVLVSYDKLNPDISSPSKIPIYGEIITARWAYEALAVHQFKENEYERLFYQYDKKMSNLSYMKDQWIPELEKRLNSCERNRGIPEKKNKTENDLLLLRNELTDNIENNNPMIKLSSTLIDSLYLPNLSDQTINRIRTYLKQTKKIFISEYNKVNHLKDSIIQVYHETPGKKAAFLKLKADYHNKSLEEFVTNSKEFNRIVEFRGRLYQKTDQIFKDPQSNLKAHFYAPRKKVISVYLNTFWVNIFVIWIITALLYITLQFRLLYRTLNIIDRLKYKQPKKKN